MKKSPRLSPTRADALVAAAVLLLALLSGAWFSLPAARGGEPDVRVTSGGTEIERMPLSEYARTAPHVYANNGFALTVVVTPDGALDVTESTCPNHDCEHTPPIRRAGQSIVCLPARVSITLAGAQDGYDIVAG